MRRYPASSAVNDPVSAWIYTKAMMITRILTICATAAACAAGTSFALAQGYPPSSPSYSTAPAPYPQGGYPADYGRRPSAMDPLPDFDGLEDDEAQPSRGAT